MKVTVTHLVQAHRVVDALVHTRDGRMHRVGHLPSEGWFCVCTAGKRCKAITAVREVVHDPADNPQTP